MSGDSWRKQHDYINRLATGARRRFPLGSGGAQVPDLDTCISGSSAAAVLAGGSDGDASLPRGVGLAAQ